MLINTLQFYSLSVLITVPGGPVLFQGVSNEKYGRVISYQESGTCRRQTYLGVTGDSLNGLSDSLNKLGTIEWMSTRHEEVAAFAAGAEAQITGQLAVCAGSCGPGNLHLINGLFDCHRNRVPVLAIAAHIPSSEIGSGYFQETHPQSLFQECSHYCEMVSNPEQLPQVLAIAMRKAVVEGAFQSLYCPAMSLWSLHRKM